MIQTLLYAMFFLLSLGQLGRLSFLGQQINGYLYEIPLFLLIVVFYSTYKLKPITECFRSLKGIPVFFAVLALSLLVSSFGFKPMENGVALLYFFRLLLYFLFFIGLLFELKRNDASKKNLFRAILLFLGLTVFFSVTQYFFYQDLRNLLYLGWDPHLYRLFGMFFDTSVSSAVYAFLFFFVYFYFDRYIKQRNLRYALLAILFIFVLLSFSRTTYIVFLLASFLLLFLKKRYKEIILIGVAFAVLLYIVPKPFGEGVNLARTFSIESRFADYQTGFKLLQQSPFLGIGYNHIRYAKEKMNLIDQTEFDITHAGASLPSFVEILVTGGIIGLAAFLWMLLQLGGLSNQGSFFILVVSLLSLADNILLHPFILTLLLSVIALGAVNRSGRSR